MKKSTSLLLALALTAGLMVIGLAPAGAHEDEVDNARSSTSMTYKSRRSKFVGTVSSAAKCVGGRTVKVYKITRRGNKPVGSTKTASNGAWSVSLSRASGKYGATVGGKTVTLATGKDEYGNIWTHTLTCRPASATTAV